MLRTTCLMASVVLLSSISTVQAATFRFDTDPFAGTAALVTPGRQVVGNEVFIDTFSVANDLFSFEPTVFGVANQVAFSSGLAASLPTGGLNTIVLQDSDNDNNPTTAFNAGTAANLIADRIDLSGAGFFVYFNSSLTVNRLVYSTDLSSSSADLKILARLTNPTGQGAIGTLPTFTTNNFEISAVPEPPTAPAIGVATCFGLLAVIRRRQRSAV
jgi:hypothetical protein